MEKYLDKNGKEIKAGMTIKHNDGDLEYVYECRDTEGKEDLGVNASNESHISFDEFYRKVYPLHQFDLREWEIVEDKSE